jgi:membrane associated rhomboid family serine protease/Zn-finger nucleic acid-binding protein
MRVKVWEYYVQMCNDCAGIWFEQDNFVDFVRGLAASENIPNDIVKLFKRRDVLLAHKVEEKAKVCPRCRKELRKFNYSYDSNVILDKCPDCAGIWADKGEIERAATYLKGDPNADTVARGLSELSKRDYPDTERFDHFGPNARIGGVGIVIPYADDTERKKFPLVTVLIIAVCSAVFLGYICLDSAGFMEKFGLGSEDSDGLSFLSWSYLSSGPLYFAFNMLFLWLFGDNVEDKFSRLGYLIFFACSAGLAGIVYALFKGDLIATTVGLSGGVSAIMGAYFIFYPTAKLKVFVFYETREVPALLFLGLWLLLQIISPFLFKGSGYLNTAWLANISGFIFGLIVAHSMKGKANENENC